MKLDRSGTVLMVKQFGGTGATADLKSQMVDAGGNVFFVGTFSSGNLTTPTARSTGLVPAMPFGLP